MKKIVKKIISLPFVVLGLKISKLEKNPNKNKWLEDLEINTIIDVGASKGNASLQLHKIFPAAKIYSFEPLKDCFDLMSKKLTGIPSINLFNLALSDKKGPDTIHRSSYSGSSSLRKMGDIHKRAFPITAGGHDEKIETDTMDNIFEGLVLKDNILIKIDVQGLEDKVIVGGQKTVTRAKIIIVEASFVELYEDQPLFGDIYKLLTGLGFEYKGARDPDFCSPEDGAHLQQDAIFIRK